MLPLSHLGIGSAFTRPLLRDLPFRWRLLGTMLRGLIDKLTFFLMGLYAQFDHGGWVPGKRGIAHTLLLLDAVSKDTALNGFTSPAVEMRD